MMMMNVIMSNKLLWLTVWLHFLLLALIDEAESEHACKPKSFKVNDSFTCQCDDSYCDRFEEIAVTKPGVVTIFKTDKRFDRFKQFTVNFNSHNSSEDMIDQIVIIDRSQTYQAIVGFGGAATDAAGINIVNLNANLSKSIVRDYYGRTGLRYNMLRVPMGGSDFSTHAYTYDDTKAEDLRLEHFKLTYEDYKFKIPVIHMAQEESKDWVDELKIFGSPWSPPAWMKTNGKLIGKGELKGAVNGVYYQVWAEYFVRFLNEYKKNDIPFWGMTVQNEPLDGTLNGFKFNCLGMSAEQQRDFVAKVLGPKLNASGYGADKLKLMMMDDQRPLITKWSDTILSQPEAAQYIAGVAFHWYFNTFSSPDVLETFHQKYPNHFLLSSEACEGSGPFDVEKVSLGSWQRAENYAHDILTDLQYFTAGWVDWNFALNMQGGPNWVGNFVDAPIIVNVEAQEYYKQPMYYALAHFTRFLPAGSVRLNTTSEKDSPVEVVAFDTTNNATVLVALNRFESDIILRVHDAKYGHFDFVVGGHSIHSFIWFD